MDMYTYFPVLDEFGKLVNLDDNLSISFHLSISFESKTKRKLKGFSFTEAGTCQRVNRTWNLFSSEGTRIENNDFVQVVIGRAGQGRGILPG